MVNMTCFDPGSTLHAYSIQSGCGTPLHPRPHAAIKVSSEPLTSRRKHAHLLAGQFFADELSGKAQVPLSQWVTRRPIIR
eukprot:1139227-Pelagomonas_calceolata.AAC.5